MTENTETSDSAAQQPDSERRDFLASAMSLVTWGIISLSSVVAGVVVLLDPLSRKPKVPKFFAGDSAENDGFIRVASLTAVPANGIPQRFPVISDVIDAWTFSPNQPIGAVWVVREAEDDIRILHTTCPHLGCAVSFDDGNGYFHCPCHNSVFNMSGEKVDLPGRENPSPRPMDALEWENREGNLYVKFENYYSGIHDKKPKL